jgi:hypothetical protein
MPITDLDKVKEVFLSRFCRQLSSDEANSILEQLKIHTGRLEDQVRDTTGINLNNKYGNIEIWFSPLSISKEVDIILSKEPHLFESSNKYKNAREMMVASRFSVALKKYYRREWMIKGQDAPDIILTSPNYNSVTKTPIDAIRVEVTQVHARDKNNWSEIEIEEKIAETIRNKKFIKGAGMEELQHLLVHLNFNSEKLDLYKVHEELKKLSDNPFHQIWLLLTTSPDWSTYAICLVYPEYKFLPLDMNIDSNSIF